MSPNDEKNSTPRDNAEPSAGFATVPIWLVVVFGGLFYSSQLYLSEHAGGFDKQVYAPFPIVRGSRRHESQERGR